MPVNDTSEVSLPVVGVCPACEELFALPGPASPRGRLECPHCQTEVEHERLRVRSLRPAVVVSSPTPVVASTDSSPSASVRPTLSQARGWTPPSIEPNSSIGTGNASPAKDLDKSRDGEAQTGKALSEPFGTTSKRGDEPLSARGADSAKQTSDLLKEFGFDFRDTPLDQEPSATDEPKPSAAGSTAALERAPAVVPAPSVSERRISATPKEPIVAARASVTMGVSKPVKEASQLSSASDSFQNDLSHLLGEEAVEQEADRIEDEALEPLLLGTSEPRRHGWSGPISAVAGLLMIAVPAAWLTLSDFETVELPMPNFTASGETPSDRVPAREPASLTLPPAVPSDEPIALREAAPSAVSPAAPRSRYEHSGVETATYEDDAQPDIPAAWSIPKGEERVGSRYGDASKPELNKVPDSTKHAEPAEFTLPDDTLRATPPAMASAQAPTPSTDKPIRAARSAVVPANNSLPTSSPAADRAKNASFESVPSFPLRGAPLYDAASLAALATGAREAAGIFSEGSLQVPDEAPSMGRAYATLCELGEALTLHDPNAPTRLRRDAEFAARDVFTKLWREALPRESSRVIARHWIEWGDRPHGGVFFAAMPVGPPAKAGKMVRYEFELDGIRVPVITTEPIDAKRFISSRAQMIGVVGVVVESPAERIDGYEGEDPRAVWSRKTFALGEPGEL
ncbi:hypothetical protein [Botrimarina hoheduenensis]|uniref:Uncharacterized protein n=1 Tax=Botrimarina hoheduenensis TaxID=2528000 RepID=A0A5C5WB47_9BACT|nr:hypothetical protein [Botrimarina hoheduenensis]TWT47737.1 hypothetical protein Pla111_13570 [Botrimarina hoheduenensis]